MVTYEELKKTRVWSEIKKIGKCDYCGGDVFDVFNVEGEGLFCSIGCAIDYHKKNCKIGKH